MKRIDCIRTCLKSNGNCDIFSIFHYTVAAASGAAGGTDEAAAGAAAGGAASGADGGAAGGSEGNGAAASSEKEEGEMEVGGTEAEEAKASSLKCDDCGKLFRSAEFAEMHAVKVSWAEAWSVVS